MSSPLESRAWFGEALRAARSARLMTRAELASALDVSMSTVANAERGHRTPSYRDLGRWAQALEMTDDGEALRRAFRFSQGFVDVGLAGQEPRLLWEITDSSMVSTRELRRDFDVVLDDPSWPDRADLLAQLVCASSFFSVMRDLVPHAGCGFGQLRDINAKPEQVPWTIRALFMPHGGEQFTIDWPDLGRLRVEARPENELKHQAPVPPEMAFLQGLTPKDLMVLKAVADGLRDARGANGQ